VNATTGTPSWVRQALEPAYSWNNVYTPTGAPVNIGLAIGAGAVLREGRDYFNNTRMPGYTAYVYPHPLTISLPPSQLSPSSKRHLGKNSERKAEKVKTWKWGKAKETSAKEAAERTAPDQ
jgi:hypothetical protein